MGDIHATFVPAAQPDIIRAAEKDEFYRKMVEDRLQDVSRSWLGPRRAIALHDEVSLLSTVLYNALTTGNGTPTLGEEYSDLHAVAGAAQLPLSLPRRALLIALQSAVPYWLERERRRALRHPVSAEVEDSASHTAAADEQRVSSGALAGARDAAAAASTRAAAAIARARALLRRAMPHMEEPLALLSRGHLALFYLYGVYYSPAYRLAGVRRVFVGRLREPRPHYRVLGMLLLAQVALATALWARRLAESMSTPGGGATRHAVLLDAAGNATPLDPVDEGSVAAAEEVPPARPGAPRCALCLSPRRAPSATPCGHVFCWPCIIGWTVTKPECPLCRAPAHPQEVVPVYNI